jgi:spore germination cell wall hydrolase CwlJ-like protein
MNYIILALILFISSSSAHAKTDLDCLAENIYHEARSEGIQGWGAVGEVVLNRVKSPLFPDTVCEVVWQHKQFSWTINKNPEIKEKEIYKRIRNIAHLLLHYDVVSPVKDSLYYHADKLYSTKEKFEPYWAKHKEKVAKVGSHVFYRRKQR